MRIGISYGRESLEVEVAEKSLVEVKRQPPAAALTDVGAAVRAALETPLGYPALRRALTPDDRVAVVVDQQLPHLAALLTPLLEHVTEAGVVPEAITLLCAPPATSQAWVDDLPDAFQEVRLEAHDPTDRRKLSYLATTEKGRRVYINRTAVDADQLVVLSGRGYDPVLGYAGSEGALFPDLSDEATRQEMVGRLSMVVPGEKPWPVCREATEVAWLLGAPFIVQVIEGGGDDIAHVLGGVTQSGEHGRRLLDARWRVTLDEPVDTVVAGVSGDPTWHNFGDLARAAAAASRIVKSGGRIVLLTGASPVLGAGADLLRRAEDAGQALTLLLQSKPADVAAGFLWAQASQQASIYLLGGLPGEVVEELFATPLENADQVQRLVGSRGTTAFLPDAHKTLAVISGGE